MAHDTNAYVGANPVGPIPINFLAQARHDTATSETVNVVYTPIRAIALTFTAAYVKRDSNVPAFQFNDFTGSVNVTYRFFRYGDNQEQ